jgi:hypothetical protein
MTQWMSRKTQYLNFESKNIKTGPYGRVGTEKIRNKKSQGTVPLKISFAHHESMFRTSIAGLLLSIRAAGQPTPVLLTQQWYS